MGSLAALEVPVPGAPPSVALVAEVGTAEGTLRTLALDGQVLAESSGAVDQQSQTYLATAAWQPWPWLAVDAGAGLAYGRLTYHAADGGSAQVDQIVPLARFGVHPGWTAPRWRVGIDGRFEQSLDDGAPTQRAIEIGRASCRERV